MLLDKMSLYTKCIPTTIFLVPLLFLAYKLFKVYKNNMDHPVQSKINYEIYAKNFAKKCKFVTQATSKF